MAKSSQDAKKVLALLADTSLSPAEVGERVGASAAAVDEARCLVEEIREAESDAILAMPPVLARALLRAAVEADRISLLTEAALVEDKEIRKEARRLAHHLELRGVKVAMPTRVQPAAPAPTEAAKEEPPVVLSNLDGSGQRVLVWSRTVPGRGIEIADFILGEDGIRDLQFVTLSKRQYQKRLESLPGGRVRLFVVPREEVLRVLDRARLAGKESGALPPNFAPWAARVLPPPPQRPPAPLEPLGEGRAEGRPDELRRLAAEPGWLAREEFHFWAPEAESLRRLHLALEEVRTSPLFLPGEQGAVQREEALRAAVEREAGNYFSGPRRQRHATWLSDMARLFEIAGEIEEARAIHATARLLADEGVPVEQIPFCRAYFSRIVFPEEGKADEGSKEGSAPLILPP